MSLSDLRALPSVDRLLQQEGAGALIHEYGRPLTIDALREALAEVRERFPEVEEIPGESRLLARAESLLAQWASSTLVPVINATGVLLHTNLGRAPLSEDALRAARDISTGYSNLEYDLESGKRGSRLLHAEELLRRLTGVEAALIVNNNASAVLLALSGLARRRKVVIARSQLVEIGGGFRIPEVMKQSGARLLEVGTTNRVHIGDYEMALEEKPALFMRAHRSNFRILGFTGEPGLEEVAGVAHKAGLPLVDDLGSGTLLDTSEFGLAYEPRIQDSLDAGADLVCFSGDKLLGGPQAGVLVGRTDLIARLRKHPLARAIRADKIALAALSATLLHYLKDEAVEKIPVWRMIAAPAEELRSRANLWRESLGAGEVVGGESTVGGGSLPGETLPTYLLALTARSPDALLRKLRSATPPVIARLHDNRIMLDPRTVLPEQDPTLLGVLEATFK